VKLKELVQKNKDVLAHLYRLGRLSEYELELIELCGVSIEELKLLAKREEPRSVKA